MDRKSGILLAVQQTDSRGSPVQQDLGMFAVTLSARFAQAQYVSSTEGSNLRADQVRQVCFPWLGRS